VVLFVIFSLSPQHPSFPEFPQSFYESQYTHNNLADISTPQQQASSTRLWITKLLPVTGILPERSEYGNEELNICRNFISPSDSIILHPQSCRIPLNTHPHTLKLSPHQPETPAIAAIRPNALVDKPFDSIQSPAYTVPGNLRRISSEGKLMATITKKDLADKVAERTKTSQSTVKTVVQQFLDEIISELARNNRLEFRDFGVFEVREQAPRTAQNPKTLVKIQVPAKRVVKFKMGRIMREKVNARAAKKR
jgi:integration host factor subunit beta